MDFEAAERHITARETDKLPEKLGPPKETDKLPEKLGPPKETDKLPEKLEPPRKTGKLPEKPKPPEKPAKAPEQSDKTRDAGAAPEKADVRDPVLKKINDAISSPEGIKALMEKHPEAAELWEKARKAFETMNDPDATVSERRSAQPALNKIQGEILELAVKDALKDAGLTVEAKQRTLEGKDGNTRPDTIAKNNTERSIQVFGHEVKPGETLSVECKCGSAHYINGQTKEHLPNQLSGQIGHKVLVATADIRQANPSVIELCRQNGAKLVVTDNKALTVLNSIKECFDS